MSTMNIIMVWMMLTLQTSFDWSTRSTSGLEITNGGMHFLVGRASFNCKLVCGAQEGSWSSKNQACFPLKLPTGHQNGING